MGQPLHPPHLGKIPPRFLHSVRLRTTSIQIVGNRANGENSGRLTELEHLRRQSLAYQLAADDMGQAIAAAIALGNEEHNRNLMLALETAITVFYMRAFTTSNLMTMPDKFVPSVSRGYSEQDVEMHQWFDERRDRAYAHTDKESGRIGAFIPLEGDPEGGGWTLGWIPFPREWSNPAVELFQRRRSVFGRKRYSLKRKSKRLGANRARISDLGRDGQPRKRPSKRGLFAIGAPRFELGTSSPPDCCSA